MVPQISTLEALLQWIHATNVSLIEVIVQDEFTHDVIVRSRIDQYLCFDTT